MHRMSAKENSSPVVYYAIDMPEGD